MKKFYITGISGTGKSTLVKELCRRGIKAFDLDSTKLCRWKNKNTGEEAWYQSGVGQAWLEVHDYVCDMVELKRLLDAQNGDLVIVAGVASNQDEYLDLFDKIFLLYCREKVFLHRLSIREDNEFAKEKSEQESLLSWYKDFEEKICKQGAIPINTEAPVSIIAEQILNFALLP